MDRYTVSGSGADCKSAVLDSGGSTPSLSTIINFIDAVVSVTSPTISFKNIQTYWFESRRHANVDDVFGIITVAGQIFSM